MVIALLLLSQFIWAGSVKIGLSADKPPYAYVDQNNQITGIEVDLIKKCLPGKNLEFISVSYQRAAKELKNNNVDIITSRIENKPGIFYSEDFMNYANVAVTRKSKNIRLEKISDLKGKSIATWQTASFTLGNEFKSLFHPPERPDVKSYHENGDQKVSHMMFWKGRVEVLVTDLRIFNWYKKELNPDGKTDEVVIHPLFKAKVNPAVFSNEKLRDEFDKNLKKLKASGEYKKIIDFHSPP